MELKIFTPELVFVGICEAFNSFDFTAKYNDKGTFTLKLPFSISNLVMMKTDNIVNYGNKTGVIESVTADISDDSTITVNGYEITYLLARRIIWNTIDFIGTVEDFCRKCVNDNCIATTDSGRIISLLKLADKSNLAATIVKQVSYDNLFDTL